MAFPFNPSFPYWEEFGIIDHELIRNLILAGGIIMIIVCALIPKPRVALLVGVSILLSVVELVGLAHFWGLTINGVFTIYVLICVGLAVDYSAHIAHAFKEAVGTAEERAMEAMTRIGPATTHAIVSTLLAVVVLSASKSYVFRVFFKVIFLLTMVAGAHSLWLLP